MLRPVSAVTLVELESEFRPNVWTLSKCSTVTMKVPVVPLVIQRKYVLNVPVYVDAVAIGVIVNVADAITDPCSKNS